MFKKFVNAVKAMWAEKRQACIIAIVYVVFMLVFYFIGITAEQISGLIAFVLLTGVFAGLTWLVKKIIEQ